MRQADAQLIAIALHDADPAEYIVGRLVAGAVAFIVRWLVAAACFAFLGNLDVSAIGYLRVCNSALLPWRL